MIKTIIKETFIMILLCVAIILILGILFYDYIPSNKVVPIKEAYETPNNVKEEINEQITEIEKTETEKRELFPEAIFGEKDYLSELFGLEPHDIRTYSPLTLAYIGDAAYEIVIRTILVRKANMQVNKLHRHAAGLVKAEKQSAMIEILEPLFTEEEKQIYKRGRNAKSYTKAKNASTIDYRRATGFEAVMGYLYLKGDYKRMIDLIRAGLGEV